MPGMRAVIPLYPYQEVGARFLADRARAGCWDPPGLGKTPQAIKACDLVGARTVLVICPAIARVNWAREFARFSDSEAKVKVVNTRTTVLFPVDRRVIVSFALATHVSILRQLLETVWDVVIVDEAHALKTETAAITRAVYGKQVDGIGGVIEHAKYTWLLTGTPFPNHAAEAWTHLRALCPARVTFGHTPASYEQFRAQYCETRDGLHGVVVTGNRDVPGFRKMIEGFYIRRKIEDVLPDLPELRFETMVLPATEAVHGLKELESHPDVALLHDILEKSFADGDDTRELEIDTVAIASLRRLTALAKAHAVVDLMKDELTSGLRQVVIFAQHLEALKIIAAGLEKYGVGLVHGGVGQSDRQLAIDEFQSGKRRVFVAQLQAASTAITLTAARDVVYAEASWVPSDNFQAAKRCHRIGQPHSVLARFIALAGSIDERVMAVLARKTRAVSELLNDA